MKKIFIAIMAVAAVLAGCKKEKISGDMGQFAMSVSAENNMDDIEIGHPATKADRDVSVEDFIVTLKSKVGTYSREWKYSDMPSVLELYSGEYIVSAVSHTENRAAWEQPVFGDTRNFTVVPKSVSNVELVCGIVNMKVSINVTEMFEQELKDYVITVSAATGNEEHPDDLIWTKAEVDAGKSGFFPVAPLTLHIRGNRFDGSVATRTVVFKEVAPADHFIFNLDAEPTGTSGISIKVDASLNDKYHDIEIPGFEELPIPDTDPEGPDGAITLEWPANPDFAPMPISTQMNVELTIKAPAGIETFVVKVDSETLEPVICEMTSDGTANMDMINDGKLAGFLGPLGLPTGDQLKGKTEVQFPLSGLVPLILELQSPAGSEHLFTMEVSDKNGEKLEQALTFYVPEE